MKVREVCEALIEAVDAQIGVMNGLGHDGFVSCAECKVNKALTIAIEAAKEALKS